MNAVTYKSKMYILLENQLERIWLRVRKNTQLPLQQYCKYWFLQCAPPW